MHLHIHASNDTPRTLLEIENNGADNENPRGPKDESGNDRARHLGDLLYPELD